ncbi:MAG: hypothetical protein K8W52_04070, partial [Deltaproteobacteria bacterium]|nr:hypothetical protein [Deltaproteobacteria bacterium]
MSKREDDLPDMEAGMTTAERRRRRRRGAGLRVPSDNVPRRSGSHSVVAPVPEDPNLAVSIAYSFAPDASGPMSRTDDDSLPELAAIAVEDHVETSDVPEPVLDDDGAALAMTADEPPLGAEADGRPIAVDDVAFDGKTREMPAVNLEALGLTFGSEPGEASEASREAAEAAEAAQAPVHDASELQDEADESAAAAPEDAAPDEPTSELAAVSASAPEPVAEPAAEAVP